MNALFWTVGSRLSLAPVLHPRWHHAVSERVWGGCTQEHLLARGVSHGTWDLAQMGVSVNTKPLHEAPKSDLAPLLQPFSCKSVCQAEEHQLNAKAGTKRNQQVSPPAPPQQPFKTPQIPSTRDHKALNRGTFGGLGMSRYTAMVPLQTLLYQVTQRIMSEVFVEMKTGCATDLGTTGSLAVVNDQVLGWGSRDRSHPIEIPQHPKLECGGCGGAFINGDLCAAVTP